MLEHLLSDVEPGDYVPGFRLPKLKLQHGNYGEVIRDKAKNGRPVVWTQEKLDKLVNDANDAKAEYGTDEEALHYITRRGKWGCPPGRNPAKWRKTLKNKLAIERKAQRCYVDLLSRLARA